MTLSTSVPNHFQLFDLPVAFDVNAADLSNRYRELARALHPDRFVRGSDQERRLAAQRMASLNEAYQALKDPLSRARYVLMINGVDADKSATDSAFLVEQMELRERVDSVRSGEATLPALAADVNAALARREQALRVQLAPATWQPETARRVVQEMQFLRRLSQQIQDLEENSQP